MAENEYENKNQEVENEEDDIEGDFIVEEGEEDELVINLYLFIFI